MVVRAHVRAGRLVLDEPTDLPEGAVVELVPVDELDDEERAALEASIDEGLAQTDRGETISADELMRRLRAS